MPFMYCDPPARITFVKPATSDTHMGSGYVKLSSGATFSIITPFAAAYKPEALFVMKLRKTDRIQLCYAPPQTWADAGPTARMAIVGDVESGAYTYTRSYPGKPQNHK